MLAKIRKAISAKRPRGKKLIRLVALLSGMVWIGSGAAFFLVKGKLDKAHGESHEEGEAAASHEGQNAHEGDAADVGDHGVSLASVETDHGNPEAEEGHGGGVAEHADVGAAGHESAHHDDHENASASGPSREESHAEAAGHHDESGESHAAARHGEGEEEPEETARSLPSRDELAALRQVVELLYQAGTLDKAVAPLRKVMLMPTREIPLLAMATDIFLGTANYQEALEAAEKILILKPDDMKVRVQAVEAQYRLGRIDKAVAGAQAALKAHPADLAMLTTLATMEVERGPGHHGYGVSLAAALKLKPDYVPAIYLEGRKAQLEGDFKDAEIAFRKVVKLDPRNAKAWGQLGIALYGLGKEEEAEKAYKTELEMNPQDYNTWFNLGELHLSHANREWSPETIRTLRAEALESFLKALELNDDHAEAHYRVGVILNGNGQYKEAIRHLEASLKTHSTHVPTLVQLSLAFENLKQPERAKAYLNKAYELDPLNKVVLFKLKQWS
jgi:tetratricopeptide (TPR) repeat protein